LHASRFMDTGSFMLVCQSLLTDACVRAACVLEKMPGPLCARNRWPVKCTIFRSWGQFSPRKVMTETRFVWQHIVRAARARGVSCGFECHHGPRGARVPPSASTKSGFRHNFSKNCPHDLKIE
jgi:hypothetical protein